MTKHRLTGIAAIVCLSLAAILFAWSLTGWSVQFFQESVVRKTEQRIQKKQQEAKVIGEKLCAGELVPLSRNNISAFCFVNGQLESWTSSDVAIDEHQLTAIDTVEQFVQFGQMWYVTQAYTHEATKIVTAVLVKKGYAYENDYLQPKISGFLHLPTNTDAIPATGNEQCTIYGKSGVPLFALVFDNQIPSSTNLIFRWLAVALLVTALFLFNFYYTSSWAYFITITLFVLLRIGLFVGKNLFESNSELFSSTLYANSTLIPTLGDLLLHALFIFFILIVLLHRFKKQQIHTIFSKNKHVALPFCISLLICLAIGIHYVWRSLILNSTIPLDLSRLDQLTRYTFIAYGILILLFASLAILIYIIWNKVLKENLRIKLRTCVLIFIITASLYTLAALEWYNHQREDARVSAWVDKLVTEHDPTAELLLHEIAKKMVIDSSLKQMVNSHLHADSIHNYLLQRYFTGYMQYYDLQATVCPHGTMLRIDTSEMDCRAYFAREIEKYGTRLGDSSLFYYLANDNGRNSYFGQLTCTDNLLGETDLFLELDSKLHSGGEGYPALLMDRGMGNRINMPSDYSYAKYADGRLIMASGNYRYPYDNNNFFITGKMTRNGFTHLSFRPDEHHLVVISRHTHTFWSLLIVLSYLLFVIGFGVLLLLMLAGIPFKWRIFKNTFQQKITILLILAFVISILCVGIATVWYNISQFRKNAMTQMEDKMRTVLTQLDYYLSNTHDIQQANAASLDRELIQLSNSMHIDINLYNTLGQLYLSSRMEIFDKQLQSERINRKAFEQLHTARLSEFVHKEKIGELDFYSMYAVYYNLQGKPIVYVNVPYFSKRVEDIREASAIITTMINVYILALLIALLLGTALANRMLRPLEIVRRNMQRLDVSKKMEYIRYDEKDELGDLIRAYNQMVEALEESTRKLAQSERESAWHEMARQIAHEIKNPLTPMRLSIQHLVRLKKDNAPDWQARFDELASALLEQIDTLAKTASEFSNFAKINNEQPVKVSLNNLLNELRPLFDIHQSISFEWDIEVKNAMVCGRPDQLSRVFVNLLTNAVQAIQDKPDGKIRVTLSEEKLLTNFENSPNLSIDKKYYYICIEDNGSSVSEELQTKLFTPNFTTKSSGTGLGLAISKKIVEEDGGRIAYTRSNLGGACFTVWLLKFDDSKG